jgi:hypothetical protein
MHLLLHGAHLTVNSVRCHQARSKMGDQFREELPATMEGGPCGLAYELKEGVVRVRDGSNKDDGPGCSRDCKLAEIRNAVQSRSFYL